MRWNTRYMDRALADLVRRGLEIAPPNATHSLSGETARVLAAPQPTLHVILPRPPRTTP
jgi:hypothetical protein